MRKKFRIVIDVEFDGLESTPSEGDIRDAMELDFDMSDIDYDVMETDVVSIQEII